MGCCVSVTVPHQEAVERPGNSAGSRGRAEWAARGRKRRLEGNCLSRSHLSMARVSRARGDEAAGARTPAAGRPGEHAASPGLQSAGWSGQPVEVVEAVAGRVVTESPRSWQLIPRCHLPEGADHRGAVSLEPAEPTLPAPMPSSALHTCGLTPCGASLFDHHLFNPVQLLFPKRSRVRPHAPRKQRGDLGTGRSEDLPNPGGWNLGLLNLLL